MEFAIGDGGRRVEVRVIGFDLVLCDRLERIARSIDQGSASASDDIDVVTDQNGGGVDGPSAF